MISISTTSNQKQTLRRQKVLEISTIAEELCTIQFSKPEISISVMELKCTEPGCPPLETAFAVMEKDIDCKFKVLKELIQVTRNDIVDAIQAWARGDAPPCGCEFTAKQQNRKRDTDEHNNSKIVQRENFKNSFFFTILYICLLFLVSLYSFGFFFTFSFLTGLGGGTGLMGNGGGSGQRK